MTTEVAEQLNRTAVFGSVDVNGTGLAVSGATITCIFGEAEVDLRAASLVGGEVKCECFVLFGSLELRAPASWRVVLDVQPFFGNAEERGVPPSFGADAPTLKVSGLAIFGSVELERF